MDDHLTKLVFIGTVSLCVCSFLYILSSQGPIQSMLIMALYNQTTPSLKYVSLAEEWLPFTDILPSATIGWVTENIPWLLEEWKEMLANGGAVNSGYKSSTTSPTDTMRSTSTKSNKPQPTPEQRRSILRDMQNYSERLSIKS
jgi:hypothetical protein